jgi:hypothetical protein
MNKDNELVLTREELYKLVWGKPMRDLSVELGMSDVGLRKLCHRNGISTPPQGYHLMSEGPRKKRLVKKLAEPTRNQETDFTFTKNSKNVEKKSNEMELEWVNLLHSSKAEPDSKQVKHISRVINSITDKLNRKKLDERGIVIIPNSSFPIRTSPKMIDMAVNTLENLLSRLIMMGASLPDTTERNSRLLLTIQWNNYKFSFRVEEFTNRFEVPVSEQPKRSYMFYRHQWKYVPTGKLTIEINGPGYGTMTMRDGKKR